MPMLIIPSGFSSRFSSVEYSLGWIMSSYRWYFSCGADRLYLLYAWLLAAFPNIRMQEISSLVLSITDIWPALLNMLGYYH